MKEVRMNHLFVDGVHQYHVCQHSSCRANRAFEKLVREQGSHEIARKIQKRELYRLYDRRWPYDSVGKAISIESVQDYLSDDVVEFLEDIIADESVSEFLETLSPKARFVAEKTIEGFAPRDIAAMLGKDKSNSIRWHKHSVKQKLNIWQEEEAED